MPRHWWLALIVLALAWPGCALAQEEATAEAAGEEEVAQEEVPLLAPEELEALVAPVAFYPDEVLAVTLPAATYPLDIVEASRFLEKKKTTPDAEPDADWDPSVLALLNYPVVLNMMNEDLDWTTSLGEAVLDQQGDVIDAIQQVRRSAYTTGHLKSDERMTVTFENDVVAIAPADPKVVYVPVYETATAPTATAAAEQPPVEEPATEETGTEGTATEGTVTEGTVTDGTPTNVTNTTNVYYPSNVAYSEPYTPYYNETASFWTGALVGGVAMGFLMDWDDDDIDIDFDEGDFDDWEPGRGDINVNGDVNIGDDIDIGNGVEVGNGDSWRKMREQRTGGEQTSQLKSKRAAKKSAQPAASLQKNRKATQTGAAASNLKKKPAQTAKTQVKKPQKAASKQQPRQKAGALGNVERGQNTVKASKRGAGSQQKAVKQTPRKQQAAPTRNPRPTGTSARPRQGGQSAFGNMNSGKQSKQFSSRGAGSQKRVKPRR
jgi:Protein of unknown function (DUF3300)